MSVDEAAGVPSCPLRSPGVSAEGAGGRLPLYRLTDKALEVIKDAKARVRVWRHRRLSQRCIARSAGLYVTLGTPGQSRRARRRATVRSIR